MIRPALYPLSFEPFLRAMPWGGQRLAGQLGLPLPAEPIGEAWLLSDHPLHASRVAHGPLRGVTLRQLMAERSEELLGRPAQRFPLLIKLLDCRQRLSIQVHPDDADAQVWAPAEGGKAEAWLVLDAGPEATIYLGLKPGVDKAMLARELALGTAELCLRRYQARPGDCYYVPAGAIHALGDGLVVLEVQQTSDATFRLHDWGRLDAQGRPRALHLEAGLACVKEQLPEAGPRQPAPLPEGGEQLVACDHFSVTRHRLTNAARLAGPCVLIGLEGEAALGDGSSRIALSRQAILVPAVSAATVRPQGQCLIAVVKW